MSRAAPLTALAVIVLVSSASAQTAEQAPLLWFEDIPIQWIEPAHRALGKFSARHADNLNCFTVSFFQHDERNFSVSFSPRATVTHEGDAITISRPTTCGLGETFSFDAEGRLTRHSYMRH